VLSEDVLKKNYTTFNIQNLLKYHQGAVKKSFFKVQNIEKIKINRNE
jgi:hypothetical protein